ncbi:MAG: bifunctional methylenetetrahydrofolate dehydrogenase/methenyltetrahydrofolate cyclohydrolase FolD [Eubacteriales bacterium]|nr:bifunctional methylenetetrahydrofolate dehydrogenase/methenyltetrahydrofolate cyclohydrolase FolD [Eubacteriales bacterium]
MIIDGKAIAADIRQELKERIVKLGQQIKLTVIIVGDNPASRIYVRNKKRACEQVGMESEILSLPADIETSTLLKTVAALNGDPKVNGILVQLPLPPHIDEMAVIEHIAPEKDVDGFHPINVGRLSIGLPGLRPCTPAGVMELLYRSGISPAGKQAVIVGRSNIVGKPLAMMIGAADATVTVVHSKTPDARALMRTADILVVAVGRPRFITADDVKRDAVIIDVGINRLPDGTLCGDVDFDAVAPLVRAITPVPGGVGPMTIAMLLKNCLATVI